MNRIFISDLHLITTQSDTFVVFEKLLKESITREAEIYILGDLCETWVGDDDDSELANTLKTLFNELSKHTSIFLLHGNRDFLIGSQFAEESGITIIQDPYQLDSQTLITHGDSLCTDDEDYQILRKQVRDPNWQKTVLSLDIEKRRKLATQIREESTIKKANKPQNITDVNKIAVSQLSASHGVSQIIHGHTHRPGIHSEPWGTRFVLGAWEKCGWCLREENSELIMECFPLAGHYENENSRQDQILA
tara:strand:+ start:638 stop:1384 length:747 start_codon:yes stop_codon:yes gene_type:complete